MIPETKKILAKFYRRSKGGNISGTQLCLSVVKHFIEAHQGSISVESALRTGTQFIIPLPIELKH